MMSKNLLFITISIFISCSLQASSLSFFDDTQIDFKFFALCHDIKFIKRYKKKSEPCPFGSTEAQFLDRNNLWNIFRYIVLHKNIRFDNPFDAFRFVEQIFLNNVRFYEMESYIVHYIKNKNYFPHEALLRAVYRQKRLDWENERLEVCHDKSFTRKLNQLDLSSKFRQKLIRAFALCIDTYNHPNEEYVRQVRIHPPLQNYPTALFERSSHDLYAHNSFPVLTNSQVAFNFLVQKAKKMAEKHSLGILERACMIKCISDESLQFIPFKKKPFKSLALLDGSLHKKASFQFAKRYGVCSNYAAINYYLAIHMGLAQNYWFVGKHCHYYNEVADENGEVYHIHPLKLHGDQCDFYSYPSSK